MADFDSLVHEMINFDCWSEVLQVPINEVLGKVDWAVVGDDELNAPTSVPDLEDMLQVISSRYGQVVKLDLALGGLYPEGAHGPFLSRVTALVGGVQVILPSQPCRTLSGWQVPDERRPTRTACTLASCR